MVARGRNSAGNADTFVGLRAAFGNLSVMGAYDVSYGLSRRTSVYLDYGRKLYPAEVSSNYGVGVTHLF